MADIEANKKRGLIPGKYIITKGDGTPVDPGAEYFVLRLDKGGSDQKHVRACRKAITAYARAIRHHLPKLARDMDRYDDSTAEMVAAVEAIRAAHPELQPWGSDDPDYDPHAEALARMMAEEDGQPAPPDTEGEIACTACGDGRLRYAISGYNKHIRACCSVPGCMGFTQ